MVDLEAEQIPGYISRYLIKASASHGTAWEIMETEEGAGRGKDMVVKQLETQEDAEKRLLLLHKS